MGSEAPVRDVSSRAVGCRVMPIQGNGIIQLPGYRVRVVGFTVIGFRVVGCSGQGEDTRQLQVHPEAPTSPPLGIRMTRGILRYMGFIRVPKLLRREGGVELNLKHNINPSPGALTLNPKPSCDSIRCLVLAAMKKGIYTSTLCLLLKFPDPPSNPEPYLVTPQALNPKP